MAVVNGAKSLSQIYVFKATICFGTIERRHSLSITFRLHRVYQSFGHSDLDKAKTNTLWPELAFDHANCVVLFGIAGPVVCL